MSDKAIMDRWDDPNAPDATERRLIYAIVAEARTHEFNPSLLYDAVTRLVLEYDKFRHNQIRQLTEMAIEQVSYETAIKPLSQDQQVKLKGNI